MPGNLSPALATLVLPQTLCTSFAEARLFPMQLNFFHDGSCIRALVTDNVNLAASIRSWRLVKRLKASDLITLRNFFEAVSGALSPWFFYNPYEPLLSTSQIGSNYDATGASATGRHTCRFSTQMWSEVVSIGRTEVPALEFLEVA